MKKDKTPKTESTSGDTATSTEVRSPTSTETSTEALTQDNVTVTGGAGDGDTKVIIEPGTNDKNAASTTSVEATATEKATTPNTHDDNVRAAMHKILQGLQASFFDDSSKYYKEALEILSRTRH